ncbi:MAG: 30S ribosomal protein S4e [DPANN group archaeon]|nr:30S ribosomal protein S4e [DPANN group archaeon]
MSKLHHISRIAAPRTWQINRKGVKWVAKSSPGTRSLELSMPLVVWIREILKVAETAREIKQIVNAGDVKVNSNVIKDQKFPVGLFDTISFEKLGKNYRCLVDGNGKLKLIEISSEESKVIPLKIIKKTAVRGGKIQIGFDNGWTVLGESKFKVGDSVMFDTKERKIKSHIKLSRGAMAYIFSGEHANTVAEIQGFKAEGVLRKIKIAVLSRGKDTFETPLNKLHLVGEQKPEIKLE